VPETISHLDLRDLLASGIALDLPDENRLALGVLKKESPFVGQPLKTAFSEIEDGNLEIIAIFRQGHTLLPNPDLLLKPEDRILVITREETWKQLDAHLMPIVAPATITY